MLVRRRCATEHCAKRACERYSAVQIPRCDVTWQPVYGKGRFVLGREHLIFC